MRAVAFGAQPEILSLTGTKQLTDSYDAYFAGELGELVKANGGDFFVDSHASDPWGAAEELWASDMRNEFRVRAGYDIVPNLAALFDLAMLGAVSAARAGPISVSATGAAAESARISTGFAATCTSNAA
jgi:hypothetical protein